MSIKDIDKIIEITDIESEETIACLNYLDYLKGDKDILIPANIDIFTVDKLIRQNIKNKRDTIIRIR